MPIALIDADLVAFRCAATVQDYDPVDVAIYRVDVLMRQILFTGFDAWRFISMIALLVGVAVVMQAQLMLTKLGLSEKLGTILVAVVIREVGPLLTNFAVIGRSGNAMASEMAAASSSLPTSTIAP